MSSLSSRKIVLARFFAKRNVKQPQVPPRGSFRIGGILEQPEKERAISGRGGGLPPVKIPEQRLAGGAVGGIVLRPPQRPERRPVAFHALAAGQYWFDGGQDLKTAVAIEITAMREQGPEIRSMVGTTGFSVLHGYLRVKKEQDARAFAIQRVGVSAIVSVDRPEIEITLQNVAVGE